MKTIRIAGAAKQIEETDRNVTLFRIQEILSEHRANLITRVLNDLSTYLSFKFYIRVEKEVQLDLKNKLINLSSAKVNLDKYLGIVHEIESNNNYRVPSHEFFREIDILLDSVLNPRQLVLEID